VRIALASNPDGRAAVAEARARGAEVICLPHLSFVPYVAARRERAGLEWAQRTPARSYREALEAAGGAWLAASAYESEGEGVFYVTARLARAGEERLAYRQRHVEAAPGRFEQMFFSPGHRPPAVAEMPWGATGLLVGFDLRVPEAWAQLAERGARVVLGGASEPAALWQRTRGLAAGMAAAYGLTVLIANREGIEEGAEFAGGAAAYGPGGDPLDAGADGLYELQAAA
jgi:predicted amidohydrolase